MSCPERLRRCALILLSLVLSACGGGGGGGGANTQPNVTGPSIPGSNVMAVTVNSGVTGSQINQLYASVTLCNPSNSACTTINNVMVDTGSVGLRLIGSNAITALGLPAATSGGQTLMNCIRFLDTSNLWGSTRSAIVTLGGMTTSTAIPIQIIADPAAAYPIPSSCGIAIDSLNTTGMLGANGVLGINNQSAEDCGSYCASIHGSTAGYYYTCTNAGCTSTGLTVSLTNQVQNPVPHFPTDNNGLVVVLPAVAPTGKSSNGSILNGPNSVTGSILFGVNTQSNNQLGTATVLTANSATGYITTTLASTAPNPFTLNNLTASFLDTGSNGIFFGSTSGAASIPIAADTNGWYVPTQPITVSATLTGVNQASKIVSFVVADNTSATGAALSTQAGILSGNATSFDAGLPFFYGRSVFLGMSGITISNNGQSITGPYYAF